MITNWKEDGLHVSSSNHNTEQTDKTNEYIAEKVCDGWFGNGFERRKKLEDAGYDYNEVQSIVNEKMATKSMEEIRSRNRNMSNYRILKAMITECLDSNDISYIDMILNLAETIVDVELQRLYDDAIDRNEDENNNEEEDESDD